MSGQQYAELFCFSNFTFLTGASHPHELAERAHELGYTALSITDACSVAGIPRAWAALAESPVKLITGIHLQKTLWPVRMRGFFSGTLIFLGWNQLQIRSHVLV